MKNLLILSFACAVFTDVKAQIYNNGDLYIQSAANLTVEGNLVNTSTAVFENKGTTTLKGNVTNDASTTAFSGAKFIFAGTTGQIVSGTGALRLRDLDVNNASGITLSQQLVVEGTVTFISGDIVSTDANYPLIFSGSAAGISGVSNDSHTNGWVAVTNRVSFEFPTGDGAKAKPILLTNIQNTGAIIKAVYSGTNNKSINGTTYTGGLIDVSNNWWQISAPSNTADVTLYSKEPDDYGSAGNINFLRVARLTGSLWNPLSTTLSGSVTNGSISAGSVSSSGSFAIGIHSNALPIRLLSFNGHLKNEKAHLYWKVDGDEDVAAYFVEEGRDGQNWMTLAKQSSRLSRSPESYTTVDESLQTGKNYYRLRIEGLDGKTSFSQTIALQLDLKDQIYLQPSLVTSSFTLIQNKTRRQYFCLLNDASGRTLKHFNLGPNSTQLDVTGLSKGQYFVIVSDATQIFKTLSFVVQ